MASLLITLRRTLPLVALLAVIIGSPAAAFAQSAPPNQAGATAPSATTSSSAPAASAAASAAPASASASSSGQPVGANPPVAKEEPVSLFAYLLMGVAALWLLYMIASLGRIRPRRRARVRATPTVESSRPFLSFAMPLIALLCVGVVVATWGILFLRVAAIAENYTLVLDVVVIVAVMAIAAIAAWDSGIPEDQMPAGEAGRKFLTMAMPLIALVCVGVVVAIWGILFLRVAAIAENYTLLLDLVVIIAVMVVASIIASKGGSHTESEVH